MAGGGEWLMVVISNFFDKLKRISYWFQSATPVTPPEIAFTNPQSRPSIGVSFHPLHPSPHPPGRRKDRGNKSLQILVLVQIHIQGEEKYE